MIKIIAALVVFSSTAFAQVTYTSIGAKRFSGEVTVTAKPAKVCSILTDCDKLCTMLGAKETKCSMKPRTVGSFAPAEIAGDKGTLHVVFFNPNKELRISFEPDNGSYLCESKWIISPAGSGSKISYEERYTESGPMTPKELDQCKADMEGGLSKLQEWCK